MAAQQCIITNIVNDKTVKTFYLQMLQEIFHDYDIDGFNTDHIYDKSNIKILIKHVLKLSHSEYIKEIIKEMMLNLPQNADSLLLQLIITDYELKQLLLNLSQYQGNEKLSVSPTKQHSFVKTFPFFTILHLHNSGRIKSKSVDLQYIIFVTKLFLYVIKFTNNNE